MLHPEGVRRLDGRWPRALVVGLMVAGLGGCGSDDLADLRSYVAEVKQRQKVGVEPLPEIKTVEPYVFSDADLRDPFLIAEERAEPVAEEVKVESGIHPDMARTREELESYELDSLRMVGTLDLSNTIWGLVRATDGTIHRVRAGNYLGKNFGRIIRVRDDQIELMEIVPDNPGTWRERKASLELAAVSGGK
jgi:type IV pilus assembly protein PilP